MILSLPLDKRRIIALMVQTFSRLPGVTIRDFSQLIGFLVSVCPAVRYGWLYIKILEWQKYLFLQQDSSYDAKVKLPIIILDNLD